MPDSVFTIEIRTEADLKKAEELLHDLKAAEKAAREAGVAHDQFSSQIKNVETALASSQSKVVAYNASIERLKNGHKSGGEESDKFEKSLYSLEVAMSQIGGHARIASEGVFQLFNSVRGFQNLGQGLGAAAGIGLLPLLAGAAAVVGALEAAKHGIEEFAKAESAMTQVDAALAQKGLLSGDMRERMAGLAEELSRTTRIAKEEWLPVLAHLIQFGADESNIDQYSEAVKNLAGIMGGDIQSAGHVFTRIMQGNVEILHRYGIQVAEGESNTETLNNAMEALARAGGGQLEAMANTLTGRFRGLRNSITDLFEDFGRHIASTGLLQEGLQLLTAVVDELKSSTGGATETVEGLTNKIENQQHKLNDAKTAWHDYEKAQKDTAAARDEEGKHINAFIERMNVEIETTQKLRHETEAQARALIDQRAARGEMSPEQVIKAKAGIEKQSLAADAQTDREKERLKVLQANYEWTEKLYHLDVLRGQQMILEAELHKPQLADTRLELDQRIKDREAEIKATQESIENLGKAKGLIALPGQVGAIVGFSAGVRKELLEGQLEDMKRELDEMRRVFESHYAPVQRDEKGELAATDPKQIIAKKHKDVKDQIEAFTREVEAAKNKYNESIATFGVKTGGQAAVSGAQQATVDAKTRAELSTAHQKMIDDAVHKAEEENKQSGLIPGQPGYMTPAQIRYEIEQGILRQQRARGEPILPEQRILDERTRRLYKKDTGVDPLFDSNRSEQLLNSIQGLPNDFTAFFEKNADVMIALADRLEQAQDRLNIIAARVNNARS